MNNSSSSAGRLLGRPGSFRLALGLLTGYAVYLLTGNVLLNSEMARDLLNRHPDRFQAGWERAWTLYPGHLHVTKLALQGQVRRIAWAAQVDSASGRIALLPLLVKELRVPHVRATGVTGGIDRLDEERPVPPARPGGWTLRFDRVEADDVRGAAFNDVRLEGAGSMAVGFMKVLRGGELEVLPSQVAFAHANLTKNDRPLLQNAALEVSFAVARHRRDEAPGLRKLDKADIELTVAADTYGLAVGARSAAERVIGAADQTGRLDGHLVWRHGEFEPGGELRVTVPIQESLAGQVYRSEGRAKFEATDDALALNFDVLPEGESELRAEGTVQVRGRSVSLADLPAAAQRTSGRILASWQFESLGWIAEMLPTSHLMSFDGAARVNADLTIAEGAVAPGSSIELRAVDAVAHALGSRFAGRADATLQFRDVAGTTSTYLDAVVEEFQVSVDGADAQPEVVGRDLKLEAIADDDERKLTEKLHARLRFEDAEVPDLRVYNRYLPSSSLRIEGGSGKLSGDLYFDAAGQVGRGEFKVSGETVRLGLAELQVEGDIAIETKLKRADLQARRFNADGSRVALSNLRVLEEGESRPADWWGEIVLDKARLDWQQPMDFDGTIRMHMKDVGPLLEVYSKRKNLPAWVRGLVDAGEANAEGRVQWRGDTLLVPTLAASNARFDVLARLRMQAKQLEGDLFARWGLLGLGVELANGTRTLHVAESRKWYDERPGFPAL